MLGYDLQVMLQGIINSLDYSICKQKLPHHYITSLSIHNNILCIVYKNFHPLSKVEITKFTIYCESRRHFSCTFLSKSNKKLPEI